LPKAATRLRVALALSITLAGMAAAPAAARTPRDFFGVVPQGSLAAADFDRMRGVVGTLRVPVYWYRVEPRRDEFDFGELDEIVGRAAESGIEVLPFVYGSPGWATGNEARPPLDSADRSAWASFLRRLVRRYGPRGDFWQGRSRREPIRRWQIWNEPNFLLFWRPRPSPRGYARLLRLSARAVRGEDSGATIVAAGVAPVEAGITPWAFLRRMYEVQGVRRHFDIAALHPYAPHIRWVATQIRLVRRVMSAAGDSRKPLQLTELGVASAGVYQNPFDKGPRGQASFLRRAFRLAIENRRRWRLTGLDWFTWQDAPAADPHCVFCQYGGLFDANNAAKPSWWTFRRLAGQVAASSVR
jgi:polysaccharide biosynthesis protein PslG